MKTEVTFSIGRENSPLDTPPYKAYFYWIENGQLIKTEDYTIAELKKEILNLDRNNSSLVYIFQDALAKLIKSNL